MKTKVIVLALGAVLATVISLHSGHEAPKDGNCPLQATLNAK